MTGELDEPGEVEIVLFEISGQRYGADASQVLRIDRPAVDAPIQSPLGAPQGNGRALVFKHGEAEAQLRVDLVHGVRTVALETLRRLPSTAGGVASAIGVWLDGERPVVLIDLLETVNPGVTQGRQ